MSKDWRVIGKCCNCGKNIYAWQETAGETVQIMDGSPETETLTVHKGCQTRETFSERPDACPQCGAEITTTDETWACSADCGWWQGY